MLKEMKNIDKRYFEKTLEEQQKEATMKVVRQATMALMKDAVETAKIARVRHDLCNSRRLIDIDNDTEKVDREIHIDFNSMMNEHHEEEIVRSGSQVPS